MVSGNLQLEAYDLQCSQAPFNVCFRNKRVGYKSGRDFLPGRKASVEGTVRYACIGATSVVSFPDNFSCS